MLKFWLNQKIACCQIPGQNIWNNLFDSRAKIIRNSIILTIILYWLFLGLGYIGLVLTNSDKLTKNPNNFIIYIGLPYTGFKIVFIGTTGIIIFYLIIYNIISRIQDNNNKPNYMKHTYNKSIQ